MAWARRMDREPEKQKGHPRSLMPHGDAMKINKLRRWPLCPWYLRDCEAVRIAVRAVREPLRWAPAVVVRRQLSRVRSDACPPIRPVLDA